MKIVERSDASYFNENRTIYTVQIDFNRFVDVMHVEHNNLFYVMQEEDGNCIFDANRNTFVEVIDENKIIALVQDSVVKERGF